MSKIKYNNLIYSFDIETTTIKDSNSHITDVYLSNFTSMDFLSGEINKPLFLRSWSEINDFLYFLNNQAKDDKKTLIFVHNLGYEFDGLIKNCEFVKKNFNNENSLFIPVKGFILLNFGFIASILKSPFVCTMTGSMLRTTPTARIGPTVQTHIIAISQNTLIANSTVSPVLSIDIMDFCMKLKSIWNI